MSVSVLVTELGARVSVCTGAAPPPPPEPPEESCFSWWPPPPEFAAELVVVVVVVVEVGAVVPFEPQATDSTPTAAATMPTVNDALLPSRAVFNANGLAFLAKLRRDSEIHSYLHAGSA
jgi:hypothetical protein